MRSGAAAVLVLLASISGCTAAEQGQLREDAEQLASEAEREARDAVSEVEQELESRAEVTTDDPAEPTQPAPDAGEPTEQAPTVTEPAPDPTEPALEPTEVAPEPTEPAVASGEPTEVAAVSPSPGATPSPTPGPSSEAVEEEGRNWWPLVLAGLALLAVVALMAAAMARRRAERERVQAAIRDLVGTGRWVHDQGSLEVMRVTEPGQLERSWQVVRERLVGMEERVASLLVDLRDRDLFDALQEVSETSESLRSALDGNVSLRTAPGLDPGLVADSGGAVRQRRNDFGTAVDRLADLRG